jgi:hypothetical protein
MNREVEESRGQARKLQADAADGAGCRGSNWTFCCPDLCQIPRTCGV